MKKLIALVFAFFTLVYAEAQTSRLGLKAGINYAGFVGDDAEDKGYESQVGLLGGLVVNIGISDRVGIKPEILYSAKGSQIDVDNQRDEDDKYNLKYIDVPILINVNAGNLFFEIGPQVGYLLSAKFNDTDIKDNYNKIDFGYAAGLGYMLDNGINIGLRYNGGLSEIYNDDAPIANKPGYRNSAFQLTLGYMWPGK
ncbi:MAG: PorT family protein [Hymenobacteraceae bacterium]|nr:PorT family protein [Hymenobacteraceae bacterium]MDX5397338.1 PorT family protein [Hymenobacteraceae bacterium]MDX5513417.1 PorT family protein [Hymenobacteraceae bacterium]